MKMRNPNGYGTVFKLKGKRRKPWIARVTIGWEKNDETGKVRQIYKAIGYFEKQADAINALAEYNKDPYDFNEASITFKELYEKWSPKHFEKLNSSTVGAHRICFKKCTPLHERPFKSIKSMELQDFFDETCSTYATKQQLKKFLNLMYFYANKFEITDKDYAKTLEVGEKTVSVKRRCFTEEEIERLWNNVDIEWIDSILIMLYSGWRVSEMLELETENIDLDNLTMVGGKKTAAGKNRVIPIHPKILPLIRKRYDPDEKYLFRSPRTKGLYRYSNYIYTHYTPLMKKLGIETSGCHDCRHTVATLLRRHKVDPLTVKRILGHTSDDLTEKVYTHTSIEELRMAINTLK